MPDTAHLLAFLLAAVVLAATPGPGMLDVFARSLGGGRGVGLRSSLGTSTDGSVHLVAAAIGVSAVVASSATASTSGGGVGNVKRRAVCSSGWACTPLLVTDRRRGPLSSSR